MAQEYTGAAKALKANPETPFVRRSFMLLLLATTSNVDFDEKHAALDAVLKPVQNNEVGRYALRTQVIRDPTNPLGGTPDILQFFMVDPNRDMVLRGMHSAVIYEVSTGTSAAETPLFLLTPAEVDLLVHGEGFATPLRP
jgi:hypothetical protein